MSNNFTETEKPQDKTDAPELRVQSLPPDDLLLFQIFSSLRRTVSVQETMKATLFSMKMVILFWSACAETSSRDDLILSFRISQRREVSGPIVQRSFWIPSQRKRDGIEHEICANIVAMNRWL